jgi:sulfate permease, SulP family
VATGFIAAAAILIIITQLPTLLGLGVPDRSSIGAVTALIVDTAAGINFAVVVISAVAVAILVFCKLWLGDLLRGLGLDEVTAANLVRPAPMYVVMMGVAVVAGFSLDEVQQVAVVGDIPGTAPNLVLVSMTVTDITLLLPSALLMAMVIFLESMSVGAAVASKRREKIDANQELVGLGFANIGAGLVGGFPVAGSFARTVVNHSVGAASPLSGVVTAVLMIAALVGFSSLFYFLPKAILSAIIVVSAAQLIDVEGIRRIFAFNPIDGITFAFTFVSVLVFGVETGILIGIVISFVLLIRASSKPHIAIVGRWGDTEHFRNVQRHEVITSPRVLAVRIDESLYFVNTRYIETFLLNKVAESQTIEHVLLICTATNFIDSSGLEMLEQLSANFASVGVTLHLSEVKGPVMDRLRETDFYAHMSGKIFFTTDLAMKELAGI